MVSTPVSGTSLAFLSSPGAPVHGLVSYSVNRARDNYLEGILLDSGAPGLGVVTFVHTFYYHTSLAMFSRCSITTLLGLEMA